MRFKDTIEKLQNQLSWSESVCLNLENKISELKLDNLLYQSVSVLKEKNE